MVIIKEIVFIVEVFILIVFRVLNFDEVLNVSNLIREKILRIVDEFDYVLLKIRKVKNKKCRDIGIIYWYNYEEELDDLYYLLIRLVVEKKCNENKFNLVKLNDDSSIEDIKNVNGIIVIGKFVFSIIEKLEFVNENIVFVDFLFNDNKFDFVMVDIGKVIIEILNYLYKLGYRRIGFIGGKKLDNIDEKNLYIDERDIKYKEFMERKKIYNFEYIYLGEKYIFKIGYNFMIKVLKNKNRFIVFFIVNDVMVIGVYKVILEFGLLVLNDVSVVGFND